MITDKDGNQKIFPADAGVNHTGKGTGGDDSNIPRGCGGEPVTVST